MYICASVIAFSAGCIRSRVRFEYECFFFCKQKTAYEMRISDWSSDVCSSDLLGIDTAPAEQQDAQWQQHQGCDSKRDGIPAALDGMGHSSLDSKKDDAPDQAGAPSITAAVNVAAGAARHRCKRGGQIGRAHV